MIFVDHLTIPANTPQTDPVRAVLDVLLGTITLVSVQFPPGVNALAHIQIKWGLYQLFPSNQGANFSTGGETIAWDEDIAIDHEPAQLTIEGWNEDDTYQHTITVRVVMQPSSGPVSASQAVQQIFQQQSSQSGGS